MIDVNICDIAMTVCGVFFREAAAQQIIDTNLQVAYIFEALVSSCSIYL